MTAPHTTTRPITAHMRNHRGSTIVVAIGMTGLIFTLTLSLSVIFLLSLNSAIAIGNGNKAYYAAESAVEESLYMIAGHGPGFQFDSDLNEANALDGVTSCATIPAADWGPFTGFTNGATREWDIDARVASVSETVLAANSSQTFYLFRDISCPYVDQPINPTDLSYFENLYASSADFEIDIYYISSDCDDGGTSDPRCPSQILPDFLLAEPGVLDVAVDGGPITVGNDEIRLDDELEVVSDFRLYDSADDEWESGESLYDNSAGSPSCSGGWCLIVDGDGAHPDDLPAPVGTKPFATNISTDTSTLYNLAGTELDATLYIDEDNSGTVSSALATRWIVTAKDELNGNTETSIQFDDDSIAEGAGVGGNLFDLNSASNREPNLGSGIYAHLTDDFHEPNMSLSTFTVPMRYALSSNSSTVEPIPSYLITISAQGEAGASQQILQTIVELSGSTPIFSKTTVF